MSARPMGAMACRIALFTMDTGDYQTSLKEDCNSVARRYGFPVRTFSADNDSRKQIDQIQACLDEPKGQRPTVILTCPVRDAALLSVAYASARLGVGWVLLGRWSAYMSALREEFARLPIFSVAADQWEVGRIQGRQIKVILPEGGELVYIRGPLGTSSATRRFEGMQEILQDTPIKVFAITSDWTIAGGKNVMKDWLQIFQKRKFPQFVVGAQNDAMAMGARSALEEVARSRSDFSVDQIRVTGCDGTASYGRRLVTEGQLMATVIMPPTAGRAVSELAPMLGSDHLRPEPEISLPPQPFPQMNLLVASVDRKRSQSG
jgi:ABC-type sugar transport system substrate-binding protein